MPSNELRDPKTGNTGDNAAGCRQLPGLLICWRSQALRQVRFRRAIPCAKGFLRRCRPRLECFQPAS